MKPFCSRGKNGLFFFVVLSFDRLRKKLLYPCVKTYKNVI